MNVTLVGDRRVACWERFGEVLDLAVGPVIISGISLGRLRRLNNGVLPPGVEVTAPLRRMIEAIADAYGCFEQAAAIAAVASTHGARISLRGPFTPRVVVTKANNSTLSFLSVHVGPLLIRGIRVDATRGGRIELPDHITVSEELTRAIAAAIAADGVCLKVPSPPLEEDSLWTVDELASARTEPRQLTESESAEVTRRLRERLNDLKFVSPEDPTHQGQTDQREDSAQSEGPSVQRSATGSGKGSAR